MVGTLTEDGQLVYHLWFVQKLTTDQVAERLGSSYFGAVRKVARVERCIAEGFVALILAEEVRPYCPRPARILDEAAFTGDTFTVMLLDAIVRHFADGPWGDNCPTCNEKCRELLEPYAPCR